MLQWHRYARRNGHYTWALEWGDTALATLSGQRDKRGPSEVVVCGKPEYPFNGTLPEAVCWCQARVLQELVKLCSAIVADEGIPYVGNMDGDWIAS